MCASFGGKLSIWVFRGNLSLFQYRYLVVFNKALFGLNKTHL